MVKAMKYRELREALVAHGCTYKPGKGDHEKWYCSCGLKHMTVVTRQGDVSPGVIRQAINRMVCLPKGWLQ